MSDSYEMKHRMATGTSMAQRPSKGFLGSPSSMWKAGFRLLAIQLITRGVRNAGVPVHRLHSRTGSCALHSKPTFTAEAETEQVTC